MTLGELILALRAASVDPVVEGLAELLEKWKVDASNAEELRYTVERYIGYTWIASDEEHKAIYSLWSTFRDDCIEGCLGMTMNERLFCFDLIKVWDGAKTEAGRAAIRRKIDFEKSTSQ